MGRQDDDGAHAWHTYRAVIWHGVGGALPAHTGERCRDLPANLDHVRVTWAVPAAQRDENLACFAELYEVANPGERIDRALRTVELGDRVGDACGALFKGLRQRVALARALLNDPEVLFLDEPTAGLDPVAARDVHDLIGGLRKRGVTIFLMTHRLEEAERLCDRVAILNTTHRTIGRPAELRDRLFARTLTVRTVDSLPDPAGVFAGLPAIDSWRGDGQYEVVGGCNGFLHRQIVAAAPSGRRPEASPRRSHVVGQRLIGKAGGVGILVGYHV